MNTSVSDIRYALEYKKGQRDQLKTQVLSIRKSLKALKRTLKHTQTAQEIIQSVAKITQEELQYHISDLVSLALQSVFDDPYKLDVDFVVKRGRTECELWFERRGEKVHPLTASGGGAVDVASFALRVALWALPHPHKRPVLILDEPFRFLSSDLQARAGEMLKEISEKLNLQIIMVSHVPDLIESADKVFEVRMREGRSLIR